MREYHRAKVGARRVRLQVGQLLIKRSIHQRRQTSASLVFSRHARSRNRPPESKEGENFAASTAHKEKNNDVQQQQAHLALRPLLVSGNNSIKTFLWGGHSKKSCARDL